MTTLFGFWLVSLLLTLGTIAFAQLRGQKAGMHGSYTPHDLGDFFARELGRMASEIRSVLDRIQPERDRAVRAVTLVARRGHDVFIERVFGRIEVKKGNASSFFVRHIALAKKIEKREELGVR